MTGDGSRVLEVAKTDKDPSVRAAAVKSLVMTGNRDDGQALETIYKSDSNADVRKAVLETLFMKQDGKSMVELARAEKDPAQKLEIVRKMSLIQSPETKAYMLEVLK